MGDTGYEFSQVHVLRHTFQPSIRLEEELSKIPQVSDKPFVMYGSDERVVPLFDTTSRGYNIDKLRANKVAELNSHGNFQLERGMDAQMLRSRTKGAITLRLSMYAQHTSRYEQFLSALDEIHAGQRVFAPGFYATRLYVNIPFSELGPVDEARERVHKFKQTFDDEALRRLYQVAPTPHLTGFNTQRRIASLPSSEEPKTSVS